MSYYDSDPDNSTDMDELKQRAEDVDPSPLADDLDASIDYFSSSLDLGDGDALDPMGMFTPQSALDLLRPMIQAKATEDRDVALKTLAIIHLETGALLEHHADQTPEELAK